MSADSVHAGVETRNAKSTAWKHLRFSGFQQCNEKLRRMDVLEPQAKSF